MSIPVIPKAAPQTMKALMKSGHGWEAEKYKGATAMRKKKPYKILEERLKNNYIIIEVFKRRKIFSFGLSTSIGYDGVG
jgi:hypothetical protein